MSKRLRVTFYILLGLYIILILTDIYAFYIFGFIYSDLIIESITIALAFFIFKKNTIILPISFFITLYWLITNPVLGVHREGLGAIIYIYNSFINGFWQSFFLLLSSWLIPVVSLVGCIYWYLDIKQSKSLDKNWSE